MEYEFSITCLIDTDSQGGQHRSAITPVKAEADLAQYSELGWPDSFSGKLVSVTQDQLLRFKFGPGVEVAFRGKRYKFEEIEKDGTFQLRKAW